MLNMVYLPDFECIVDNFVISFFSLYGKAGNFMH